MFEKDSTSNVAGHPKLRVTPTSAPTCIISGATVLRLHLMSRIVVSHPLQHAIGSLETFALHTRARTYTHKRARTHARTHMATKDRRVRAGMHAYIVLHQY